MIACPELVEGPALTLSKGSELSKDLSSTKGLP